MFLKKRMIILFQIHLSTNEWETRWYGSLKNGLNRRKIRAGYKLMVKSILLKIFKVK